MRYWVVWWSTCCVTEGCKMPPFQVWFAGNRRRNLKSETAVFAVIDTDSEDEVWQAVKKHFPDYQPRICAEKSSDWQPDEEDDRFRNFEGRTSITSKPD